MKTKIFLLSLLITLLPGAAIAQDVDQALSSMASGITAIGRAILIVLILYVVIVAAIKYIKTPDDERNKDSMLGLKNTFIKVIIGGIIIWQLDVFGDWLADLISKS